MQTARLVIDCMARNVGELFLWLGIGTCAGVVLGVFVTLLAWKLLFRRGWLDMGLITDPFYRWTVVSVWVVGIPCLTALAGLTAGLAIEVRSFVHKEPLVEQSGKLAFQTVVSLAISASRHPSVEKTEQVAQARSYLENAQPVKLDQVEQLALGLPEWLENEACNQVNQRLGADKQGHAAGMSRFIIRWTVGWWTKSSVDKRMKVIRPVVKDLHSNDKDGLVTSEEIAISICRVHLKPHVERFAFELVISQAISLALLVPMLIFPPVLLAQLVALGLRWWRRRHPPELPPLHADPGETARPSTEGPVTDPNAPPVT